MPSTTTCTVNSIFLKYSSLSIGEKYFRSSGDQSKVSAVVLATWDEKLYGSPSTELPTLSLLPPPSILRPVNIMYFMKVYFSIGATNSSIVLAHISWFSPHPDRHALGKPAELWCASLFESFGLKSYLPVTNITSRCAHGFRKWNDENLLVVVPLIE